MRKRWKDWLTRPRRWMKPAHGSAPPEPRHRPLAVEQIEDRLMLSALVPSVEVQGGFIDIHSEGRFSNASAYTAAGEMVVWLDSDTTTAVTDATPQGGGVPVQHPEMAPIGSEELASAPSQGGMIDLTRMRRETIFGETSRLLPRQTGTEYVAAAAAKVGEATVAMPTRTGAQPRISSAVVQRTALPGSPPLNEPIRVSSSVPTLERIHGSRGRSRAFELAIGFPAATARDEYSTHAERFPSGHSFRDGLDRPTDPAEKTAEAVPNEESDEKSDPPHREGDSGGLRTQGRDSKHQVEPAGAASADVGAVHRQAVFAEMASTESDVLLPGVFLDKKRPGEVASLLTVVAVGHYLTTRQRQDSDTHPRRIWVPRRRRPL